LNTGMSIDSFGSKAPGSYQMPETISA
jgi:hypothetical protein